MKLTRIGSTVLAAACLLSLTATNSYGSTTSTPTATQAEKAGTSPTPGFRPPYQLAPTRLLAVQGAAGHSQKLTVAGIPSGVAAGTVIVSAPGNVAQAGLLVKVVSLSRQAAKTILSVVPAGLAEALAPGTYTEQVGLTSATGKSSILPAPGVVVQPNSTSDNKNVTISQIVKCTGSVTSVHITGSLSIRPTVDLSVHVHGGSIIPFYLPYIDRAAFSVGVTEDATLHASLTAAASCQARFDLAKLTLPVFFIGPVPVLTTVKLTADAKVGVNATLTVDANQHFDGTAGLNYANGVTQPFQVFHTQPTNINLKLAGQAYLEVGITGSAALLVAGLGGPHLDARAYVGVSANPAQTPWWRTYFGLRVSGGLRVSLFGLKDFNLGDWTLYQHEWTLTQALGITTASLPSGLAGLPYSARISPVGGKAPYTFSAPDGLPAGLTLNADGTLTGTPTLDAGGQQTSTFRITVFDANHDSTSRSYTVTIRRIMITPSTLPGAQHGAAYNVPLSTVGANGTVAWSLVSGSLPAGLSLSNTGVISGVVDPSAATSNSFIVRVTDQTGVSADQSYSVAVVDPQPLPDPGPRPGLCPNSSIQSAGHHIDRPFCPFS